ncbi:hypothetical protein CEXT_167701 [Caerostris extrusa]|uniref:Secreted protein n=1 Tax=Caerostris extrusa TaxID=172846 RepID=A0AAV4PNS3_CAEEX|nr:hypothetical protein CEXT_167701 [Caerostris extrusa]
MGVTIPHIIFFCVIICIQCQHYIITLASNSTCSPVKLAKCRCRKHTVLVLWGMSGQNPFHMLSTIGTHTTHSSYSCDISLDLFGSLVNVRSTPFRGLPPGDVDIYRQRKYRQRENVSFM